MKKIIRTPWFWLIGFTIIYMVSRLINITTLPIFTDEAIYVRWAQIGGRDASWRFISLTDGKQPLFTWAMMVFQRVFHDPLFAGRFTSVISGFFGMIGMYMLGKEIFKSKRIGIISSFLYLISPFALFYDRLALYDSLVSAFSVWNLYLAILLVRYVRLDIALIFGLTLGIGMLNKTSAFFSLYLLPFTLICFDWKEKLIIMRLIRWVGLALVSAILSQLVYAILRLSPYFYIIAQKDTIFVYPFSLWIMHPLEFLNGNITGMFNWLIGYASWPIYLSAMASLFFIKKSIREKILLLCFWFLPFLALALFGRVLYPRHILFMIMPLLILSAWTIDMLFIRIRNRYAGLFLIGLICSINIYSSFSIIYDIKTARIPKSEMGQYIDDWPSGWGVPEIVAFLKKESEDKKVSVFTEGTFGLLPYAFEIYLGDNKNIDIHGIWPVPEKPPKEIVDSAADHPTYFVMYQNQMPPIQWTLELLSTYPKGLNKNSTMRLYKVNP